MTNRTIIGSYVKVTFNLKKMTNYVLGASSFTLLHVSIPSHSSVYDNSSLEF